MNPTIAQFYEMNRQYSELRNRLMDALTDADLAFQLPGANVTLGALCREIGETEYAYVQSFKTFKADFTYRNPDTELESSLSRLRAWYQQLDAELQAALEALTDNDVQNRVVERDGFQLPVHLHLDVYREALLIFYGKVSVYLKAMNKPLPDRWSQWIG